VTEDLSRYASREGLPTCATLHDRADLDAVQRELRELPGVSVIIYDQTCAAEKRRRRKKKEMPQASERVFINELVCEGCGDCGKQSNCTSILPKETEFGRKRVIDQSSCNNDFSCLKGFCPSFVTVTGGTPRRTQSAVKSGAEPDFASLTLPQPADLAKPFNILITGIGGTGVITIGALIGMAAHLERKGASVLDMTGMSQKNGAVTSHVRIAAHPADLRAQRIATGEADLVLACDMLTAGSTDAVAKMRPGRTLAVVNSHEQPAGPFARNPDWEFPAGDLRSLISDATAAQAEYLDATSLATALLGDAIAANLFLLGYAFQRGAVPVSLEAMLRAIELNGVSVQANTRAFQWGRMAAEDFAFVKRVAQPAQPVMLKRPESLQQLVDRRTEFLTGYQNSAYAASYADFVSRVRRAEETSGLGDRLSKAVATNLFKLMAYKDEYEVARLFAAPEFRRQLEAQFDGKLRLAYHLAPPALGASKRRFGDWTGLAFKVLARLKFLRGTVLDPFGRTQERRMERDLIAEYRMRIEAVLGRLTPGTLDSAVSIARVPEKIRGFGHVKQSSVQEARTEWERLASTLASAL
jgi:indolepyruvate ferredoxin oxidoreductase